MGPEQVTGCSLHLVLSALLRGVDTEAQGAAAALGSGWGLQMHLLSLTLCPCDAFLPLLREAKATRSEVSQIL